MLAALVGLGPAAGSAHALRVTFIGDSKAAGIEFSTPAKRLLARGYTVRRDLKVCRRLVAPSCTYQGVTPLTVLQAIRHYGRTLGAVLIVDVGYNDTSSTYRKQLDQVMLAARNRGVKGVVWVNLRAVRPDYWRINAIINQAAQRWLRMYVANWNVYSRGHPSWFAAWDTEGLHLTSAGAVGLVRLVRRYIPLAAQGPRDPPARTGVAGASAGEDGWTNYVPLEGAGDQAPTETETAAVAADLTGNSPPVGSHIGGADEGSTGLSGILPFAGGAALMLFLIFVTVKRRGAG